MFGQPPSAVRRARLDGVRFHIKDALGCSAGAVPGGLGIIQFSLSRHFRAGLSRAAASRLESAEFLSSRSDSESTLDPAQGKPGRAALGGQPRAAVPT